MVGGLLGIVFVGIACIVCIIDQLQYALHGRYMNSVSGGHRLGRVFDYVFKRLLS